MRFIHRFLLLAALLALSSAPAFAQPTAFVPADYLTPTVSSLAPSLKSRVSAQNDRIQLAALSQRMLMAASGSGGFAVQAVDLNGSTDDYERNANMTGVASNSQITFNIWFRIDGGNGTARDILRTLGVASNFIVRFQLRTDNKLALTLGDGVPLSSLSWISTSAYTAGATWHNWLVSADTNFSAGNKLLKVMIDGTQDTGTVTDASNAFTVGLTTVTDWFLGGTGFEYSGCLSEFWFNQGTYLDVTTAPNLAKFYSGGKPVNLGANGSTPTGSQPLIYDHVSSSGAASDFGNNLGSGGGWTINGSPALCSTHP